MARGGKIIAGAAGGLIFVFIGGFVVFASTIAHYAPAVRPQADGIVVLTGGQHRLSEAARLLTEKRGQRLLISGVNRVTTREDLFRTSGLSAENFNCCVDIGYAAHDTSGNADETKAWTKAHRFKKVIIVTSSYHMPRSMTELGRAIPHVVLIPYPVVSKNFRTERWWMHAATARLLFWEYLKFLPSAARFGVARLFQQWENSALADVGEMHAACT